MEALLIKKFSGTAVRIAWPMLKAVWWEHAGLNRHNIAAKSCKEPPKNVRGGSRDDQQRLDPTTGQFSVVA